MSFNLKRRLPPEHAVFRRASHLQMCIRDSPYTVQFPDGKQMDIKCCGCQDEPSWTEAVLFDEDGSQLCCTEPGDSFGGPWELQYEGIRYTVTIKTEHT